MVFAFACQPRHILRQDKPEMFFSLTFDDDDLLSSPVNKCPPIRVIIDAITLHADKDRNFTSAVSSIWNCFNCTACKAMTKSRCHKHRGKAHQLRNL